MHSLVSIFRQLDKKFVTTGTQKEIYASCKDLASYISVPGGFSKQTKPQLLSLITACRIYLKNATTQREAEYKKFKFGDKKITLDAEQHAVVIADHTTNCRVIAAAGTGKTTTILCRTKYLIDNIVSPDKILILTFNIEACKNLKTRIHALFGFDVKIETRTIDSFCYKLVSTYTANKVGFGYSLNELSLDGAKIMAAYAKEISAKYRYVFFDEFQDVNENQFRILQHFAENDCYLTVIGDDNQNIYQFRGTNNYYIINFDQLVTNTKTFMITNNYRSTNLIVELANHGISHNMNRVANKNMQSCVTSKLVPKFLLYSNQASEYSDICNKIQNFVENLGVSYNDIAIVSRTSYSLKIAEEYLQKNGIPNIALITDANDDGKPCIQTGKITIATIHRVKGLEWSVVFLIGLGDDYFPVHMNSGLKNIEEERRLFYVAVTRAKRYLFFMTNLTELPVSRFVQEIESHVAYTCLAKKKYAMDKLFEYNDENFEKTEYSVTEIIRALRGDDIKVLKNIIPDDLEPQTENVFDSSVQYTDRIKNNYFEADFGNFIDRVISRELMLMNGQVITDYPADTITNAVVLSDANYEKYTKHEAEFDIPPNSLVVRENTYPKPFLEALKKAYKNYTDPSKPNNTIMKSIYYVSICGRLLNNRRNLIYRDVYDVFMEQYTLLEGQIAEYVASLGNHEYECKIKVCHKFSTCSLAGEIDYVNRSENMIVDLKCSESSTIKFEWFIQVLLYAALRGKSQADLGVFNIMDGKFYKFSVKEYDRRQLLEHINAVILREISGQRYDGSLLVDVSAMDPHRSVSETPKEYVSPIKITETGPAVNYMVMDVETSGNNVIQIAYIIYDPEFAELKKVNHYVKNRTVDINSYEYSTHHITTEYLRNNGVEFVDVMTEFLNDLVTTQYIIGHNTGTDICHIEHDLKYFENIDSPFTDKTVYCTMNMGKVACNLRDKKGRTKAPKLAELYKFLYGKDMANAHDAYYDIKYTMMCFRKLRKTDITEMLYGETN